MNDIGTLLSAADQALTDGGPRGSRVACWFARSALEVVVTARLAERDVLADTASMRSKLTCLRSVYADLPSTATQAAYAWERLSQACHQHAYELSPTYAEAAHLVQVVRALAAGAAAEIGESQS